MEDGRWVRAAEVEGERREFDWKFDVLIRRLRTLEDIGIRVWVSWRSISGC